MASKQSASDLIILNKLKFRVGRKFDLNMFYKILVIFNKIMKNLIIDFR